MADQKQARRDPQRQENIDRIDRFVQSVCQLGMDLVKETELEQGCEPGSAFEFVAPRTCKDHLASNYFEQKLMFLRSDIHMDDSNQKDSQLRKRIKHFVSSKADLVFKLKGKQKLRSGIDYNADGYLEAYSLFATQVPPLELGMKITPLVKRAQMFQKLKVGDLIIGEVVGKRPFGIFVKIKSLIHGRNLDFSEIDIQAMCHKSELAKDHKSREHFDPIDDFEIGDLVRGVICSVSVEEERVAISFRSSKIPSEYGNIELGIIEDSEEQCGRKQSFDEDRDYNYYLENDPGFANPANVQTLIDVLGIDTKPPNSLLRSCQQWSFGNHGDAASLRKQQSLKWSMSITATGVENFKSGNHDKALKCFDHALKIHEDNAEALVARGALYANQNKLENAIKDFRKALIVHPKHHNAHKYLKETLFEKGVRVKKVGQIKEAIGIFREVLDMDPDNRESQNCLEELQVVLSKQCEESLGKERKASVGSAKESGHFEHVRKLIEADPVIARTGRKKKRKKKKQHKELKRKKSNRRKKASSTEATSTASEGGNYSDQVEWVEDNLPRKRELHGKHAQESQHKDKYDGQHTEKSTSGSLPWEKHEKQRDFQDLTAVNKNNDKNSQDSNVRSVTGSEAKPDSRTRPEDARMIGDNISQTKHLSLGKQPRERKLQGQALEPSGVDSNTNRNFNRERYRSKQNSRNKTRSRSHSRKRESTSEERKRRRPRCGRSVSYSSSCSSSRSRSRTRSPSKSRKKTEKIKRSGRDRSRSSSYGNRSRKRKGSRSASRRRNEKRKMSNRVRWRRSRSRRSTSASDRSGSSENSSDDRESRIQPERKSKHGGGNRRASIHVSSSDSRSSIERGTSRNRRSHTNYSRDY